MKIRQNSHEIYTDKNIEDFDITATADFHYDDFFSKDKLKRIEEAIISNESKFICIVGDLINENNIKNMDPLLCFLEKISKYSKTLISFGNHEMLNVVGKDIEEVYPNQLITLLYELKNVIVLNNDYYNQTNVEFAGLSNSFDYYDGEKLEDFIKEANDNLWFSFSKRRFNVLMSHSPINIIKSKDKIQILDNCDLVLSGHNHNGLVFPCLERSFKNTGLINHRKDLFPKNSRGNITFNNTDMIITGGITKFSNHSKFQFANDLYYMDIDKIKVRSLKR